MFFCPDMLVKIVDFLTILAMAVILIIFLIEFTPIYRTTINIFSANAYGF